jgi:hypothetical protein
MCLRAVRVSPDTSGLRQEPRPQREGGGRQTIETVAKLLLQMGPQVSMR